MLSCDQQQKQGAQLGAGPGDSIQDGSPNNAPAPHPLLAVLDGVTAQDNTTIAIESAMAITPMEFSGSEEPMTDAELEQASAAASVLIDSIGTSCNIACTTTAPVVFRYIEFAGYAYSVTPNSRVHCAANTTLRFALNNRHPDVLVLPHSAATIPLAEVVLQPKKRHQPAFDTDAYSDRKVRLYFEVDGELRVMVFELEGWAG